MNCPNCQAPVDDAQRFCPACGTMIGAEGEAGPDPMLGKTFGGKYHVVRLLGEGGMGAVYEGEQQLGTTKRKVAVKTLHPHLSRDAKIKARFEREVGTIAELTHPNTIQVFDFGTTDDGILYLVMEFLQGRSLADALEKDGPMTPERAAHIMDQVCGSLAEAHARGIVHRDLKPDNVVLLERAGRKDFVKVLDFGIAKRAKEEDKNEQKLTQQGMVLGTPPYMSPEQFTGRPIDSRSDIYSLGVMAFEMLAGRLPFQADTAWEWATQHMTQPPLPLEQTPAGARAPQAMRDAIRRALSKSPDERYQDVGAFNDAFQGAIPAGYGHSPSLPTPAPARGHTEVGTPLDVSAAAAYATPPPHPATHPGAAMPPFTPAAGNMSMPMPPGGIAPPPEAPSKGGGRGMLLGIAAIVGLASVAAIAFAVKGGGFSQPAQPLPTSTIPASDPTTVLTGAAPTDIAVPPLPSSSTLPPLAGGSGGPPSHPSSSGAPHPTTGSSSGSSSGGTPTSGSSSSGGSASGSSSGSKGPYNGPECQTARQYLANGQRRMAQQYVLQCIAKGGSPY